MVIRSCTFLTYPFRCYSLGEVCRVDGVEHIGQVAQFLVRQAAYLRKSGGEPAPEIRQRLWFALPQGFSLRCGSGCLAGSFVSPFLLKRMEAPPGDLLPSPLRGRCGEKRAEALCLGHIRPARGEI